MFQPKREIAMSRHISVGNHRLTSLLKLTPIVVLLATAGLLRAEEITYTGDGNTLRSNVQTEENSTRDHVFAPFALSGNVVWIDFASETNSPGGSDRYFYGGVTHDDRPVSGNTVRVVQTAAAGPTLYIAGGHTYAGVASGNRVFVTADVYGEIIGGVSMSGSAVGNEVFLYSGTIEGEVFGGEANAQGAMAMNNTVTLDGAHVLYDISGGQGDLVIGNVVNLNSGQLDGSVYAAFFYGGEGTGTINLNGDIIFGDYSWLRGAIVRKMHGSILNVRVRSEQLYGIGAFDYINFYLSPDARANDVILDVTEADIDNNVIGVRLSPPSGLRTGDEIRLIRAVHASYSGIIGTIASYDAQSTSPLLKYEFDVWQSSDGSYDYLNLKLLREYIDPAAKSLSEGRLASTAWLGAGADLALTQLTPDALRGRNVFGTVSAGTLRFNTGSHIDVNGYNLISGFSGLHRMDTGELSGGAFFEHGQGDYDSTNSFPSGRIKGSGRTEYTGLGALIRFDTANGSYLDAFLRGGRTETDYRSSDLRDASGRRVEYDIDGTYYGVHLGVGKRVALDAASSLDLSARLLWTHQNGASATLSTGEQVEFESVNSTRLRLGTRYTHTLSERIAAYAGVGVDHEFDSKARATLNDFKVDTPDMRGTTGQAELGLRFTSGENGPLTMEAGLQGYAGKREGVTANFRLHYKF